MKGMTEDIRVLFLKSIFIKNTPLAVQNAVVDGQAEVDHMPDGNHIINDHRLLDDGFNLQYGSLGMVDDPHGLYGTEGDVDVLA